MLVRRRRCWRSCPFVAGPFLRISVDALDRVEAGAFVGSLLGVLVLVAVPVLLLGAVAPYAVRLSVRTRRGGRAASPGACTRSRRSARWSASSSARCVLIPLVGHAAHVPGLRAGARARRACPALRRRFVLAPVGASRCCSRSRSARSRPTGDARVIWERETEYQYARVVERADGERRLELNEGQAVHSVYRPGEWLTGDYWDEMLVLPFAAARARRRARSRSSATPPARRRAPTATTSRRRASTRVEIDARADRRRAPALRPARAATCTCTPPTRGRSCAAPTRRYDVDRRRRLPPALHPVLPGDARVLREVARPPRRRAAWCSSTSATREGSDAPREGADRDDGPRRSRRVAARPGRGHQHAARWAPTRRPRRARCDAAARALPRRPAPRSPRRPRRGWRRRCAAARSTPTTARRSSG